MTTTLTRRDRDARIAEHDLYRRRGKTADRIYRMGGGLRQYRGRYAHEWFSLSNVTRKRDEETRQAELEADPLVMRIGRWGCAADFTYVRGIVVANPQPIPTGQPTTYTVWFEWRVSGRMLDRPVADGISTGTDQSLANRLSIAVECAARELFTAPRLVRDYAGDSYVDDGGRVVHGKTLAADLDRLTCWAQD